MERRRIIGWVGVLTGFVWIANGMIATFVLDEAWPLFVVVSGVALLVVGFWLVSRFEQ